MNDNVVLTDSICLAFVYLVAIFVAIAVLGYAQEKVRERIRQIRGYPK